MMDPNKIDYRSDLTENCYQVVCNNHSLTTSHFVLTKFCSFSVTIQWRRKMSEEGVVMQKANTPAGGLGVQPPDPLQMLMRI